MKTRLRILIAGPLFMWLGSVAQAPFRILYCTGDIHRMTPTDTARCAPGGKVIAGEGVLLRSGAITLLDERSKRLTLDKPGTYPHSRIMSLFKEVNATMESKFLEYVWDEMTHGHSDTTVAGGVHRGEGECFPPDSSFLVGDSLELWIPGGSVADVELLEFNGRSLVHLCTRDSALTFLRNGSSWWKPGSFELRLTIPPAPPRSCTFHIPDEQWTEAFQAERARIAAMFPGLAEKDLRRILDSYDGYRRVIR